MLTITFLGHASFLLEEDGYSIVLDPYYDGSVPGLTFPKNIVCNDVFISHEHKDHSAKEYVSLVKSYKHILTKDIILNHDKENGTIRGKTTAKIMYFPSFCVCHLGDIGDIKNIENMECFKDVDIFLIPINGYFTISAQEAFSFKDKFPKALFIPMHYEIIEKGIGYQDNSQIELFRNLFNDSFEVNSSSIQITKSIKEKSSLIFNSIKQ